MKSKICALLIMVIYFTLSSCMVSSNVDDDLIITYGIPYYNTEGLIVYYTYYNEYYYPYYYHNRYYFHKYPQPLPPHKARKYRPVPRNFYKYETPHRHYITPPHRTTRYSRPNPHINGYRQHSNINRNGGFNRPIRPTNPNKTMIRK